MLTQRKHCRRISARGFTLLELIVVMVLIAVLMALATPQIRNWGRVSKMRGEVDRLLAATRYLRTQAILDAKVYRLVPRENGYAFTVQQGMEFVEFETPSWGRAVEMPPDITIRFDEGLIIDDHGLCFYPDGRVDAPTWVQLEYLSEGIGQKVTYTLECLTRADAFQVTSSK